MEVDRRIVREGVVDDVGEVGDVDTPRRHVGGDQELRGAGLDPRHHLLALRLLQLAGDHLHVQPLALQVGTDRRDVLAGVAEDDGGAGAFLLDEVEQRAGLVVVRAGLVQDVGDRGDVVPVVGEEDLLRLLHVAADEALHRVVHRRGEQEGLAVGAGPVEDLADVLEEAHRQHLVGFVEHRELKLLELQVAAPHVIHDAARGSDHDLAAVAQRVLLGAEADAAVDGGDAEVLELRDRGALLRNLDGQLAGGAQHQRAGDVFTGLDLLDHGDAERGRLARPGLGPDEEVLAGEGGIDRERLDGRGHDVAERLQAGQDFGRDREVRERAIADVVSLPDGGGGRAFGRGEDNRRIVGQSISREGPHLARAPNPIAPAVRADRGTQRTFAERRDPPFPLRPG